MLKLDALERKSMNIKSVFTRIVGMLLILILAILPPSDVSVYAAETEESTSQYAELLDGTINKAVNWLYSQQQNGVWGDASLINDTCEALGVLKEYKTEEELLTANEWVAEKFSDDKAVNNDMLARCIIMDNGNVECIEKLISTQNPNGGFGLSEFYTSDVLDSMLALEALHNVGTDYSDNVLALISYLITMQNDDGGWGYTLKSGSDTEITIRIVNSIHAYIYDNYIKNTGIDEMLSKADEYLSTISETDFSAENYDQTIQLVDYTINKSSVLESFSTIEEIIATQQEDGSFYDSLHSTYLTIRLLLNVKQKENAKTEVKGMTLSNSLDAVFVGNETLIQTSFTIDYYTNADEEYTLETNVYDKDESIFQNEIVIDINRRAVTVSGEAIQFILNESEEKELKVEAVLLDELGNVAAAAEKIIEIRSKFIDTDVLYIADTLPWDSNANEIVLNQLGVSYDKMTAQQALGIDLLACRAIIVANDQSSTTYRTIGTLKTYLESFVKNGGTLVYGICDGGWQDGSCDVYIPGDVKVVRDYQENNYIVDEEHPIVTAYYSEQTPLLNSHLISSYWSHIYFDVSSLPEGTNVILNVDADRPTLIEYTMGKGSIIASGLTWEHAYTYKSNFGAKALDDLFLYALNRTYEAIDDDEELGTISSEVTTDKDEYLIGEQMQIHTVSELSSFRRNATAVVTITDLDGNVVDVLEQGKYESLTVGIPVEYDYSWDVEDIMAGEYKAVIQWFDGEENIGGGEKVFQVLPDQNLSNQVTVLGDTFTNDDIAVITEKVLNNSTNSLANDLVVRLEIFNEADEKAAEAEQNILQIRQQSDQTVEESIELSEFAPGTYRVVSTVYQDEAAICTSETSFSVIRKEKAELLLSGSITAADVEDDEDSKIYQYIVSNDGNQNVTSLGVNVTTYELASGDIVDTQSDIVDITKKTAYANTVHKQVETWNSGDYLAVLSYDAEDGNVVTLGAEIFHIEERIPPYFLTGYALFARTDAVTIDCSQMTADGNVYAGKEIDLNGSVIQLNDKCTTPGTLNKTGWIVNVNQEETQSDEMVLDDYTERILSDMKELDGYEDTESIYENPYITQPVRCSSLADIYWPEVKVDQYLVCKDSVCFNTDTLTAGGESDSVICSETGNIQINATKVNVRGLIYVPNGTVTIKANELDIQGTIIAKEIIIQGTDVSISKLYE